MPLGNNNLTTGQIRNYIRGNSFKVSELAGKTGLNPYSFYATGFLSVDSYKDVILTPPIANFKMGDFRSYDREAAVPKASSDLTLNWGPGGSTFNRIIPWFPNAMNIKEFAVPGDYVTYNFYTSVNDRAGEINRVHTFTALIVFNTIMPLPGHTRQTTLRANSTQLPNIENIPTAYTTLYLDAFISDISGNRLINFGLKANGYSTLTLVESSNPHVSGQNNNNPYPPSGYTTIFPNVYDTARCTPGGLSQSIGTNYTFSVAAYGVHSGGNRTIRLSSVDIILTVDGVRTVLLQVGELPSSGISCSGILSNGSAWNNGDNGYVTFENAIVDETDFQLC